MALDRGDWHIGDAKTWERACRHMGLFLWWAAERGLASEEHIVSAIRVNPTKHFIEQCDTKLWDEDLTGAGNAFAESEYDAYLTEVGAYGVANGFAAYGVPECEATTKHFFDWLDRRLAAFDATKT